jgi:hypothetical protein
MITVAADTSGNGPVLASEGLGSFFWTSGGNKYTRSISASGVRVRYGTYGIAQKSDGSWYTRGSSYIRIIAFMLCDKNEPVQNVEATVFYLNQTVEAMSGGRVRVAGRVVVHQASPTAKGFHFITLEDEEGLMDVVVRPQIYVRYRRVLHTVPFCS